MAFSGTYFLSYKDMFHFDQPALLGMVLLWIGIASYERDRRRALLYPLAAAAVSLGRGYASLAVLIAWLATQTAAALATARRAGSRAGARELAGMESLRVLLVCAGLAALFLGYNVLLESRRSGLPLGETSILSSASRRLGFDRDFDLQFSRELAWRGVVATQLERYLIASTPAVLGIRVDPGVNGPRARLDDRSALFALSLLVLAALALVVPRRRGPVPDDGGRARSATRLQRRMLAVLALTGPIWLLSIRRLAQFHDYTAMYYLGTLLAVDLLILGRLPRRAVQLAAAVALALFVAGNFDVQRRDPERAERANAETREMERIASVLPGDARVYVDGDWRSLIEGAPLALGFYLADATLVEDVRRADYALSRRKVAAGGLTPENRHIFAYATRQRSQP
jgi:hypothetical protein